MEGIEAAREPGQSVASYVRRALQRDLERRLARDAAAAFKEFVETHPDEKQWLDEWDGADLADQGARAASWRASSAAVLTGRSQVKSRHT